MTIKYLAPDYIDTDEKKLLYQTLHDDITDNGTELRIADRYPLADLAVMMIERNRLVKELEDNGEGLELEGTRNSNITKKNFARTAVEKLRPQILAYIKEFKMTPASRKTKSLENPKSDGFEEFQKI